MIGEFVDDSVIYKCPTHSYSLPIGKSAGIYLHMSHEMAKQLRDNSEEIRKAVFTNLTN